KEDKNSKEPLPDTGSDDSTNTSLFGGLFAALGSLLLFGRRKKQGK
ncbi:LPXTG cell wall anchor domain-containing protein, partial [Staphylococcus argenteus]